MSLASLATLYLAGLASFFSPCVLPLLPSYLTLLAGAEAAQRGRPWRAGLGFTFGLSFVFVVLGMGASALSSTLSQHRHELMLVAAALMLLFGAKLLGVVRLGALDNDRRPLLARVPSPGGFAGGALFGVAFAVGWTPCVGPVLGATLSYAASSGARPALAAAELGVYALGLSTPLLCATLAAERVLPFFRKLRGATLITQRAVGGLLVAFGIWMLGTELASSSLIAGATAPTSSAAAALAKPCDVPGAVACAVQGDAKAPSARVELPTGRPHLVEFVSGHCVLCARMAPLVSELERLCTKGDGTLVRASVESESGRALAEHFAVHAVPTFLQLDASGKEVERVIGEQSRDNLARRIEETRGEACAAL